MTVLLITVVLVGEVPVRTGRVEEVLTAVELVGGDSSIYVTVSVTVEVPVVVVIMLVAPE